MKRVLSVSLVLLFILSSVPFHVLATEADATEYSRIIDLACEVFPEYVNQITDSSRRSSVCSRTASPIIVFSETRPYNNDTFVTYSQTSDGAVILSSIEATDSMEITNSAGGSGGTTYTATLTLAYTIYGGLFKATNVMFTIASQRPDIINSSGTLSGSNLCDQTGVAQSSYTETSSEAFVRYRVCFVRPDAVGRYQHMQFYYTLYVGGNAWRTTVTV